MIILDIIIAMEDKYSVRESISFKGNSGDKFSWKISQQKNSKRGNRVNNIFRIEN